MRKFKFLLVTVLALGLAFTGCKKNNEGGGSDSKVVGTFTQAELIAAVTDMYNTWLETTEIPSTLTVGGVELTVPQYQYAMCRLLTYLVDGNKSDVEVYSYKAASNPDRDSYDKETIAVTGGAKDGAGNAEDLYHVASYMMSEMESSGQVPNRTLFYRGSDAIAFSTNRATVCLARAIAGYSDNGKFDSSISTEYLSASATLKAFAEQVVSYLDVWENTVGTVDADGSHCTDNGTAWENVHFIPIPQSGGYTGDMYSEKYQPYHTITVNGVEYTAAQCWVVGLKGILDLITKEGSNVMQEERNTTIHTLANGAKLGEPIPLTEEWGEWGGYPWYEKADDPCAINFSSANPCDVNVLLKVIPWFLTRASQLTHIGNFQTFGDDPGQTLVLSPYKGNMSAMRMFLVMCRFYKYLLDNNITENVYDAVKDVAFDYDLYGVDIPGVTLITESLSFETSGGDKTIEFTPNEAWTASTDASWLTLSPTSGDASVSSITVTAPANSGEAREATVTITAGSTVVTVSVKQSAYNEATIKEFVEQYVTILDVWKKTTGTIDMLTGEDYASGSNNVENAHYVPSSTTITVGTITYNTADMMELAERCYLLLRGYDGNNSTVIGAGNFDAVSGYTMSSQLPATHNYQWASSPYNETSGNGGHLVMGSDENGTHCQVKLDILDNFAQRHLNWPQGNGNGYISNLCGYVNRLDGYYGCFCAQRALITYAFFFQYMLDNDLQDATSISADTIFRSELFGDEEGSLTSDPTIGDFAKAYVGILDVWEKTTGTINMYYGENYVTDETNEYYANNVYNAHYVPSTTTIKVGDKTYNTADMIELAERCYLLLRGYDGTSTTAGNGGFSSVSGYTMDSTIPETHGYLWGDHPYNEIGTTSVGGATTGNGGHLRMGDPKTADGVACQVKLDILDNFAQRHLNWPLGNGGGYISNMCGYIERLDGYYGCFCAQRALITYAFFFKYMIENSLSDATAISADTIFRSELFGDES